MKQRLRVVAAAVACSGLLAAAGTTTVAGASTKYPPIPKGPITVGISTPLSGTEASYGVFTKLGIDSALAAFDAAHPNGIDGHQVKIDLRNDASDVTQAVQVANQLVANKDAAVITVSYNPAAAAQQLAVFTKAKMPVVADLTGAQYANAKLYPYLFSPNPSVQQSTTSAAQWIGKMGYKKVAMLDDGIPADVTDQTMIIAGMKKDAPKAKLVATTTITAGSVDDSAAITKLKQSNADLLVVNAGESYGPIWQAIQASGWSPAILTSAGAWYNGFTAMGSLEPKAYAYYWNCADTASQAFSATQSSLMASFASATSNLVVNYLTFIATDSVPLELLDYAITKHHSVAPAAIQNALEGLHNQTFLGFEYNYSAKNHYGLIGPYRAAVCHMGPPYAGGVGKVPVKG